MKFDKLVQTVLNEYNKSPDVVRYYKYDPHTNKTESKELYVYDDPPSEEEGWFRTWNKAKEFAEEKRKKQ